MQAANRVTPGAPGGDDRYQAKNSFFYAVSIASSLAPAGSTTASFQLTSDADFIWTKLNAYAQIGSDGTTFTAQEIPGVTITITNTGTGRQYMNGAVPIPTLAGNGGLPFILPMQTVWDASSTITTAFQNITDNKTYTELYLVFIGIKCFLRSRG